VDYHDLEGLRRTHPAWRLLRADHAALVIGFLNETLLAGGRRAIGQRELATRLDDYLFALRESGLGETAFPQSATFYLDAWASDESGWLRKYYAGDGDEPLYDATPAAEAAASWIASLQQRAFVGTESRLLTVFELLRQIAEGTETDPDVRIAELNRRKAALDAEIARIRGGTLPLMDPTQIKDRFFQLESTARELLADFRQVEHNFRALDRSARERIATWESGKGALLAEIFGDRDLIADSDQGKSFRAFWDFIMSPARQEEFSELLQLVFALEPVRALEPDRRLLRIHYDWLEAGEVAQRTVARLSEQLRRLLDDRVLLENRRILQIVRDVEQHAISLREAQPRTSAFMNLDNAVPDISLVMERPLYSVPATVDLLDRLIVEGTADVPSDALFDQRFIDKTRLTAYIESALADRDQVSLEHVISAHPLEDGLAELVAYLSIATERPATAIDDSKTEAVAWFDDDGTGRRALLPLIVFTR